MPEYGKSSRQRLGTCHPDIQIIWNEVIKHYDNSVICGHRGKTAQDNAFLSGNSTVRWPDSTHNKSPSMGIDSGPYFVEKGSMDWADIKAFCLFAGRVLEIARRLLEQGKISHRVRWGGDWDGDGRTLDQKFNDLVHYELRPV